MCVLHHRCSVTAAVQSQPLVPVNIWLLTHFNFMIQCEPCDDRNIYNATSSFVADVCKPDQLMQESANFLGFRAGWAPKKLAAGRTGNLREKFNNCGLAHPSHHEVMSYLQRHWEEMWRFLVLLITVLRSTPPVFSFILFFQLHQKFTNLNKLVTEGSSVNEVSQRQECKRADQGWLSVCD